jgi:hypothetical protein
MAIKKKTAGKPSLNKIMDELVEAIMEGEGGSVAEETAEKALFQHLATLDEDVVKDMHHRVVLLPMERIEVIAACLRRCAKDSTAKGEEFIEGLPGEWGSPHLKKLADDLCSGELVIEEACDEE